MLVRGGELDPEVLRAGALRNNARDATRVLPFLGITSLWTQTFLRVAEALLSLESTSLCKP